MKPLHISLNIAHSGLQTKLLHFIIHSMSSWPTHTFLQPPPHFYKLTPNRPHSYTPDAQTISICTPHHLFNLHASPPPHPACLTTSSICTPHHLLNLHASPPQPHSEYPKDYTRPHYIHLTIISSVLYKLPRFPAFIAHVSVPYVNTLWTHLSFYTVWCATGC